MPRCRDPLVAQLNALGFNTLRVPRTDYIPSKLIVQQTKEMPVLFGSLEDAFENISIPEYTSSTAGQLAKGGTAKYRKGLGLKLASDWLNASFAKLKSVFTSSKNISFRFNETRLLSISLAELNKTIAGVEPKSTLLDLVNSRLFVINEVLQVKEFIMITEGDSTQSVDASIPSLDSIGTNIEATIDSSKAHAGIFVFKAAKYHSIGFKAYEIEISGGVYQLAPSNVSPALSHMAEDNSNFEPVMFDESNIF